MLDSPLLYQDHITPGRSGYAAPDALTRAWEQGKASRAWSLGASGVTCLQLRDGGIWKSYARLPLPFEDAPVVLSRLQGIGVEHPASWSTVFHHLAPYRPIVKWTYNGLFAWWQGGPWSEALRTGSFGGRWYRYDLQSAYGWAGMQGLPDPETYTVRTKKRPSDDGLWVAITREHSPSLPPVFRKAGERVVVSTEEIERYNMSVDIVRGVTWTRYVPDFIQATLMSSPYPKESARAYWGRWIARDGVWCMTAAKRWQLRNIFAHFIWGWLIVGRVRLRCWEYSGAAAHVYVDELLSPDPILTGPNWGDWRLKEEYGNGVVVHRTGHYGPAGRATMQTGVSRTGDV